MHTQTRTSRRLSIMKPPTVLKRTSAIVPIRFTYGGRKQARKLCMEEDTLYEMYFLEHNGKTTYYLANCKHRNNNSIFEFDDETQIPEHKRM